MIGDDLAIARVHLALALLAAGAVIAYVALANRRLEQAKLKHRQERATLGAEVERLQGVLVSRHGDRAADRPDFIADADGDVERTDPEQ